ncbi:ribonuclease H-like domain-containing protein [Lenzites betulinus]|nr:ribonuclease H-like domain-containing protein [Lenzites betulinus]
MAANAFKETKALCRISPPSSPSRVRTRSASQMATTTTSKPPPFRSKLLTTLDNEIPRWLSEPSSSLADSANTSVSKVLVTPLAVPKPNIHPFFMGSQMSTGSVAIQPRERSRTAPASTSSTGKSHAKPVIVAAAIPESDIENHPEPEAAAATPQLPSALPSYSYKDYTPTPAVVYTPDEDEANDLVQCLKGPVLGFDLEWVVLFRKGRGAVIHRTALVQLSDARMIVLVHVSAMKKFPQKVKEIIENRDIVKVGANIKQDGQKLFRDYGILARNLVELGAVARHVDPEFAKAHKRSIVSLAKVVEVYTQKTLEKGNVRTSNWETKPLSENQKFYAANDAHCALVVYNRLLALAAESGTTLEPGAFGADLAQEYATKTAINASTPATTESYSASTSTSTTTSPADALPSTVSITTGPSRLRTVYSRPLIYAGEADPSWPSSSSRSQGSTNTSSATTPVPNQGELARPQHMRAYNLWHNRNLPLSDMCATLRSRDNPLAESTVISYVVRALQANPALPFSMDRLKALVQLEAGSWVRHREWILQMDGYAK